MEVVDIKTVETIECSKIIITMFFLKIKLGTLWQGWEITTAIRKRRLWTCKEDESNEIGQQDSVYKKSALQDIHNDLK